MKYRYKLGSNKIPKITCPYCQAKKHWQRFIDLETNEALPSKYGRCDNASKCGAELNPYVDGYAKNNVEDLDFNWSNRAIQNIKEVEPSFIPVEVFSRTRSGYEKNTFIQNLFSGIAFPFEVQEVERVISQYHLGTITKGYRSGANTFPFIDSLGNVRAIQVKQFDNKNHTVGTDFLHSIIEKHYTKKRKELPEWLKEYNKNETKVSCLFGEHLLRKYPDNPVALVEAPKTAIYCTLYFGFPNQKTDFIWLAVYNLSSLNLKKCKSLKGRKVSLFPDLSKGGKAFELWSAKANEIQGKLNGSTFIVSNLLERLAPEEDKAKGKDIADYLIENDWRLYRTMPINEDKIEVGILNPSIKEREMILSKYPSIIEEPFKEEPENWDTEINELESFFSNAQFENDSITLDKCSKILDVKKFLTQHLAVVQSNKGSRVFRPYLDRLKLLQSNLKTQFV